ncbi:glycerophosphodiester phosphodiesterase family protein [Vibrio crassostreae]|uniref:glycerophosphodiester phosphodiesterase family protein n=1 Tax=Vibrio crassostreae TaxID=246167 RepID=UPI0006369127|nr:glycerophosphodiester phosphodiesterase family protein [Vibrio crassostreae]TCN79622.1 glycerophosphoryl diester phosphodiesterase [Vibrio crassostreae]TCO00462.1 glycerophosphoryl diester phosphodiesterase [Vibrio crassostreae]TCT52539.1 glycerophosphoryl diester phosphodiesterase [Vibrio crassostreae]TCT69736.1 glycerophosphoryl diester phosphodiesterase [Vibrio crassostreae]TCT77604.1 glycerophosphoryl diester phosphodiesterase [Vibrio crassostreae]
MKQILKGSIALILGVSSMTAWAATESANLGPRPLFLVNNMDESPLKTKLLSCSEGPFHRSDFSIGHRGAAMQFPEHTKESYLAAIQMGAGVVECDVTFTKDKALVCRHSQSDLHTTTDVLAHPDLAKKCSVPFKPANPATGEDAQVECRTSDFTLAEFKTLKGKMDGANPKATTVEEYMNGTPGWRTDLYSQSGTLMTHAESAALFKEHGVKVTPELKSAAVEMPFNGFSQEMYAQKLVDELKEAGFAPSETYLQSFNLDDVKYWIKAAPKFGKQAVYLDDRVYEQADFVASVENMKELHDAGVNIIAPPLFALVDLDENNELVASNYAKLAKGADLDIIAWTLERSGPLAQGGGWYYKSVKDGINNDGDMMKMLDVLAQGVGVMGVFSDWPATVTYYANCMDSDA